MTPAVNGGQTGPPPTYQPAGKIWTNGEYTYVDPHGTVWRGTSGEMQIQAVRDAIVHASTPAKPQPPGDPMINIDHLRALADAATPGPWEDSGGDIWTDTHGFLATPGLEDADAAFIAAAREAIPALLDALEEANTRRDDWHQLWEWRGIELMKTKRRIRAALDTLDAIRALLKALPPHPAHGGSKTPESAALAGIHLILEDK